MRMSLNIYKLTFLISSNLIYIMKVLTNGVEMMI